MKKIRVGLIKRKKKIFLKGFECNFFEKVVGLMFSKEKNAKILFFLSKKKTYFSIHSLFVFFPFIAIWTDDKNKILFLKKVEPFTFHVSPPKQGFFNLIEIPLTKKHSKVVKSLK